MAERKVQGFKTVAAMWFLIAVINFHLGLSCSTSVGGKKTEIGQISRAAVQHPMSPEMCLLQLAAFKIWEKSDKAAGGGVML